MYLEPRATPVHNGTAPAGAMVTPFAFPCGANFLVEHSDPKCAPPGFNQYWWESIGFYSPAICPTGYTVGCLRWNSEQGPPVEPSETAAQCVPSGYMCDTKHVSMAYSYSQTSPMIQVRWAQSDLSYFATHPLYPGANPTDFLLQGEANQPIYTAGILAARQASSGIGGSGFPLEPTQSFGLPSLTTNPPETAGGDAQATGGNGGGNNSGSGSGSGSGGSNSGGGSGSDSNDVDQINKALSTGAKVGIAVGVTLGALTLIGLGVLFFLLHKKKNKSNAGFAPNVANAPAGDNQLAPPAGMIEQQHMQNSAAHGGVSPPGNLSELGAKSASPLDTKAELGDQTPLPAELHQEDKTTYGELQSETRPYELDTRAGYQEQGGLPPQSRPYELDGQQTQTPTSTTIPRKQITSPSQLSPQSTWVPPTSPSEVEPDPRVSVLPDVQSNYSNLASPAPPPAVTYPAFTSQLPTEPSPEELATLKDQHAQLESRKQRLLELEKIEKEQAALQQKMASMQGGEASS